MGQQILAGQTLVATTANGGLNQYYGNADTTVTTVTGTAYAALSSVYTIPAGEATAGSAYRLTCSGSCVWGSTQQSLGLVLYINGANVGTPSVDASSFTASATLRWFAIIEIVSADGVSAWEAGMFGGIAYASQVLTGLVAANNTVSWNDDEPVTANNSSPVTVALAAKWASATGSPTISCRRTIFQKVA